MKIPKKRTKIIELLKNNVIASKREYIIIAVLLIIGLLAGVMYVNNIKEEQYAKISEYINRFIDAYRNAEMIDTWVILKESILQNLKTVLIICFFGTTVIGLPVVFGAIIYKGFCLGYTISCCISVLGTGKGLAFIFSDLLLHNLIFIPAIIILAVSGFKLYKSIIKDRRKENIKIEIIRYLVLSLMIAIVAIIASLAEVFVSNNILRLVIKYF